MTNEQDTIQAEPTFHGLGISQDMIEVLNKLHFTTPTPIQAKTIPVGIQGKDVLGIAQTGTGKTLAFGVPMVERLMNTDKIGLVLVPTRELAEQVYTTMSKIMAAKHGTCALLIGGASMHMQIQALRKHPKIIIATPGRLNDHIRQHTTRLDKVGVFVLDEADRMLDMGFAPQIREVAKNVPFDRQTLLFSATMPAELTKLAHSFMKDPQRIDVAPQGTSASLVTHEIFYVQRNQKLSLLLNLLEKYKGSVLVFSRTKYGAKHITEALRNNKISSEEIHSNRTMGQRRNALEGFKSGKYRVLVATDIAARGIHVSGIELVVNYDLPEQSADYVHRIGRTGRAGKTGHAISFATPDQRRDVLNIERLMKKTLKVSPVPALPDIVQIPARKFIVEERGGRKPFGQSGYGSKSSSRPYSQGSHGHRSSTGSSSRPFGKTARGGIKSTSNHGEGMPSTASSKPSYGASKPAYAGSKPSYGAIKPAYAGSKPSYGASKPSYGASKSSYAGSKPATGSSHGSSARKPFGSSSRTKFSRPFKKSDSKHGDRPDYYAPRKNII